MGLAAIGVVYAACGIGGLSLGASLAGLALGLALMLPGHLIGATGAGDVKLFAAAGAFVGPTHIFTAFIYTALAGGAIAIVISLCAAAAAPDGRRHRAVDRDGGRECGRDREPARAQPVRVRPGDRRRHDAGRAGILTIAQRRT